MVYLSLLVSMSAILSLIYCTRYYLLLTLLYMCYTSIVTMLCAVWCSLDLSRASLASSTPALALVCSLDLLYYCRPLLPYIDLYYMFVYCSCRIGGLNCLLTHGHRFIWASLSLASVAICR